MILYEYPFNEKIRTYLRLEQLFSRLFKLMGRADEMDHHFALTTLFEILNVGARADLKTDVLKDLERQKQVLNAFRDNPAIATDVLDEILKLYIEGRKSKDEITMEGYDSQVVERIVNMVNANEYKRYQAPPIIRVSSKAFGKGRIMPLVAKYQ